MSPNDAGLLLEKFNTHPNKALSGSYGEIVAMHLTLSGAWFKRCEFVNGIQDRTLFEWNSRLWRDAGVNFGPLEEAVATYASQTESLAYLGSRIDRQDLTLRACYDIIKSEFQFGLGNFHMLLYRKDREQSVLDRAETYLREALAFDPDPIPDAALRQQAKYNQLKYKNYLAILLEYHHPKKSVEMGREIVAEWDALCSDQDQGLHLKSPVPGRARMNVAERTLNLYRREREGLSEADLSRETLVIDNTMLVTARMHVVQAKTYFDLYPELYPYEVATCRRLLGEIGDILGEE